MTRDEDDRMAELERAGGEGIRVAFQGEAGAFSEEAVRACFGAGVTPVPCREFREVGEAVMEGRVGAGLLPVENTLAGSVVGSHDVLASLPLEVVGEVVNPIRHCLLGIPGSSVEGLRRVVSHPVALAQCRRFFLEHPGIEAVVGYDTAGAAKDVALRGDPAVGAIAARAAAGIHGLQVLAKDLQDRMDNQTRFYVVVRPGVKVPLPGLEGGKGRRRTALLLETPNTPGGLVEALLPLARREVNLTRLEARPGERPWTYRFFLELDGDAGSDPVRPALEEVREHSTYLRVLGSFPSRW